MNTYTGPLKCYVAQMRWRVSDFREKSVTMVTFNVSSLTRGWVGVQFPGTKCYVTLEWLPTMP